MSNSRLLFVIAAASLAACTTPDFSKITSPAKQADIPHDSPDSMFNRPFHNQYGSSGVYNTKAKHYQDAVKAGCTDRYFYSIGRDPVLIDCFQGKHEDNKPYWVK